MGPPKTNRHLGDYLSRYGICCSDLSSWTPDEFYTNQCHSHLTDNNLSCLAKTCVNDDSTTDEDGDTCSDYYDDYPEECGNYDTDNFTASVPVSYTHLTLPTNREV